MLTVSRIFLGKSFLFQILSAFPIILGNPKVQYHISNRPTFTCIPSRDIKIRIFKAIVLPMVLYGCETWSLSLKAEHRLMVFEIRVLRRIFVPKRDEVTGGERKLHKKEILYFYSSPSIRITKSRRMRWAGHVA
jgi:hypothetical protein